MVNEFGNSAGERIVMQLKDKCRGRSTLGCNSVVAVSKQLFLLFQTVGHHTQVFALFFAFCFIL